MAQVPKIDSPCPLGIDEQLRLDGHCGRCGKHVHALDAMDDAERRALLRTAAGPICVSYRSARPSAVRRGAGFGIAIAATLVSGGAFATDPPPLLPPVASEQASPVTAAAPLVPSEQAGGEDEDERIVFVGGVSDPQDAQWIDDSDLPELPMRQADQLEQAVSAPVSAQVVNPRR